MKYSPMVRSRRAAFTLVELIVVITIVLILLAITAGAVNFSLNAEKVGGAARQVQSYLAGARDRAIHARAPRGVRFVRTTNPGTGTAGTEYSVDEADPNRRTINSLMFVAPSEPWTEGRIQVERRLLTDSATGDQFYPELADVVAGQSDNGWFELASRQTLHIGLRVRLPNDRSGSWYTIVNFLDMSQWPETVVDVNGNAGTATSPPPPYDPRDNTSQRYPLKLQISPPYRDPADRPVNSGSSEPFVAAFREYHPSTYSLELPNVVLPERPVILPKGTVIDLDGSDLPLAWTLSQQALSGVPGVTLGNSSGLGSTSSGFFDVMFSPRGTVTGDAASKGVLHFYISTLDGVGLYRRHLIQNVVPNLTSGDVLPFPSIPADELDVDGGPEPVGDRALVSVFTRTGAVSSHPINVFDGQENVDQNGDGDTDDATPDGIADDPYGYAETGEVSDQ